jgi:hypothetical protein
MDTALAASQDDSTMPTGGCINLTNGRSRACNFKRLWSPNIDSKE